MTTAPGRVSTGTVVSADGTPIAYDVTGTGPAVVLVHGAMTGRSHPTLAEVARILSPWFTVFNYDRRGRGDSGDTPPYALRREIDDLAAVIAAAGGSAMVFGGSSGAALALEAAARLPAVTRLALWEPPYHVGAGAPVLPDDFAARLAALVDAGARGDAVELFMARAAEVPPAAVAALRAGPSWPWMETLARTLVYEAVVMGPGNAFPTRTAAAIARPVLVLNGRDSPAWMRAAGTTVARGIPGAVHRVLPDQAHDVSAAALAPELLEFFARQ
ncbi:alpha/beta hydrolase [Actinomadura logoneensis]|uniref:Alpha/beta hydrolase n=1 Tax=Actinomadura logoneensis TaxID=2293572 RepID=A0A372JHM8_9ACTN|nr:alpha/beta hydrolase [Actinomadura logoneensis]RFU39511.1 alpha/beta hydrolase [Actinomadura logoneensis]